MLTISWVPVPGMYPDRVLDVYPSFIFCKDDHFCDISQVCGPIFAKLLSVDALFLCETLKKEDISFVK